MDLSAFEDIRPYTDTEIPAAMRRIVAHRFFPLLASFIYPDMSLEEVKRKLLSFRSVHDFQTDTMRCVNEQIIRQSISQFTCLGLERLSPAESYLYVSNHRDIMLDASLLQYELFKHGFDTTEITFGANLMQGELVTDIGKCNKMFRVERPGGSLREFYQKSVHLSRYIRYAITEKHQSVWIAQRNGRTKDGMDATDQGVIKMFGMACPDDKIGALSSLHIVPVAVSYEWEPCDILKTLELYASQFARYTKKPGEDLNSILTGIMQYKGDVHFEVAMPITEVELQAFDPLTSNEYHKAVAHLIDRCIVNACHLFPNNYIAYDLRYGCNKYSHAYTTGQRETFINRMRELDRYDTCNVDLLYDIFLSIYANPIVNKSKVNE